MSVEMDVIVAFPTYVAELPSLVAPTLLSYCWLSSATADSGALLFSVFPHPSDSAVPSDAKFSGFLLDFTEETVSFDDKLRRVRFRRRFRPPLLLPAM